MGPPEIEGRPGRAAPHDLRLTIEANNNGTGESGQAPRLYRGQSYRAVGEVRHQRLDGSEATIVQWESACAQCGAPFVCAVPERSRKFQPNRRCQKHKRPGVRVRP